MATNTRDIRCRVELYDTTTITHTQLKQGDTTHLILELYRDGKPHDLDGITLTVIAVRPDGKAVVQNTGYTVAANVAEFVLEPAVVALAGRLQLEVELVETATGDLLSSFIFVRSLEPKLLSDETVSPEAGDRITEIVINSTRAPYIGPDGAWWQWDNGKHAFVSTGVVPGEGGGGGYIIGSGLKLNTATNTLSVDTTDVPAETDARPITSQGVYNEFAVINALLKTI